MSSATSASVSTTNPGYPSDKGSVTKNKTKSGTNDSVAISPSEDGTSNRNVVVVLEVNANAGATASVEGGNVKLTASGSGTLQYLSVTLNSSDSGNWTVYVNTSGGSNYNFVKGNGGGGHK